jgi:hypothetical protein
MLGDLVAGDVFLVGLALDDDLAGHLAADRRDLALEVPDAGFAGVALDDGLNRLVLDDDVVGGEAGPSIAFGARKRLAISIFSCSV